MVRTQLSAAVVSAAFAACFILTSGSAQAIPPDRLDHYHLLPRHSVLLQTGGIAGVSQRYHMRGKYDFLQEWNSDSIGLWPTARFDNADIRAPFSDILPVYLDVDELLNLEGLRGQLLPLGAPFDVYRFKGFINDSDATSPLENSSIELYAALIGPWMYLYGETTAPPHTADFFEYKLKALARTRPWADMNEDGRVDAADYTLARDHDPAMLTDWQAQYGEVEPDIEAMEALMSAALASSAASSVPEPSAALLVLLAIGFINRRVVGTRH